MIEVPSQELAEKLMMAMVEKKIDLNVFSMKLGRATFLSINYNTATVRAADILEVYNETIG